MQLMQLTKTGHEKRVIIWLSIVGLMVYAMVLVGGATRLTDSGLSITEWAPVTGTIPPLSEEDWRVEFKKYQQIPEYQIVNKGMSLEAFKQIYYWEWGHRFLGRAIGLVFFGGLIFFLATRSIPLRRSGPFWGILALGGAQGAMGWFMVSSGLTERVDVSQYRLAAHLGLAAIILSCILLLIHAIQHGQKANIPNNMKTAVTVLIALTSLQILFGAFVAGLDAGHSATSWPTMNGEWIPNSLFQIEPIWKNAFENPIAVQFIHRTIAYILIVSIALYFIALTRALTQSRLIKSQGFVILAITVLQIMVGIYTLHTDIALYAALSHQAIGFLLLASLIWHRASLSKF